MLQWKSIGLLSLWLGVLTGCGDGINRVAIQGKLTNLGSAPVENAVLVFTPKAGTISQGAIGVSDVEGTFTVISSRDDHSGIPPGKYGVRISRLIDGQSGEVLPEGAPEADYPNAMESIPSPFSGNNSPIEVEISEAGGELAIDIPKALRGKKKK